MPETPDHECSFLFQPCDADGKPQDRDHCRIPGCGKARPDPVVATLRDIADNFIAANFIGPDYPPLAADLKSIAYRLEAVIRGEDDPGPATRTEWGAAYEGQEQPGVLFGIREYDDREGAESMIRNAFADVLVTRTVTATPWQRVEVSNA